MSAEAASAARSWPAMTLIAPPKSVSSQGTEWMLTRSLGLIARVSAAIVRTRFAMTLHFHSVHSRPCRAIIHRAAAAVPSTPRGGRTPVSFSKFSRQLLSKQLLAREAGVLSG